jgi:5-methylcytosine-specific restriction endonuclease McrA
VTLKVCRGCGAEKDHLEFYKHPRMADGHLNHCKVCRRAYQRNRPREAISEIERRRNQKPLRKAHLYRNLAVWRRENPAKTAVQRNRRRAFELEAESEYTAAEFIALCEEYGNVCLSCGSGTKPLTPDHVVPSSLGGSNLITNIQPLYRSCTSRKNAKVVDYRPGSIVPGVDSVLSQDCQISATPRADFDESQPLS